LYTPSTQLVLLNQFGGIYASEDLGKTNVTEGQVKQFAYETLRKTFTYHYLSFLPEDEYQLLQSGKQPSDLPDLRDLLTPLYSQDAQKKVVEQLVKSPWMERFYSQRRQIETVFTTPPLQGGALGWSRDPDGRLFITYKGNFFLSSMSKGMKTIGYKVNYTITLERKPIFLEDNTGKYYFAPMNPINAFEWRVRDLVWTSERRGG